MKLIRVFPRRTKATPTDPLSFVGPPPFYAEADEVHISVAFTYDFYQAKDNYSVDFLAEQWRHVAPVTLGGPAYNQPSGDFVPGRYLKPGYVITSRGCPNHCWFCSVWKREPALKELPISEGWNILDDNLLACSEQHVRSVFAMLKRQPVKAEFTGGLEAKLLKDWHIDLLVNLKPLRVFFAYDEESDWEPLVEATKKLWATGIFRPQSHSFRCYVLAGYNGDTIAEAQKRCERACSIGLMPMVMVYRNKKGHRDSEWVKWGWRWSRPACIGAMCGGPKNSAEGK